MNIIQAIIAVLGKNGIPAVEASDWPNTIRVHYGCMSLEGIEDSGSVAGFVVRNWVNDDTTKLNRNDPMLFDTIVELAKSYCPSSDVL